MTEVKIANDYDHIGRPLSLLLRHFQKEDNPFAAQCIWWLASIIQYTEILKFYFKYQTFPSEYIKDCIVMPLPNPVNKEIIVPE